MGVCLPPIFFPGVITDNNLLTRPHQSLLTWVLTVTFFIFFLTFSVCFLFPPLPQVCVLAFTFLLLFLGNFLTTLKVVHTKLQKNKDKVKKLWTYQGVLGANMGTWCPSACSRRSALDSASWTSATLWMDLEGLVSPHAWWRMWTLPAQTQY